MVSGLAQHQLAPGIADTQDEVSYGIRTAFIDQAAVRRDATPARPHRIRLAELARALT